MDEHQAQRPAVKLNAEAESIKNKANREAVLDIIESGRVNANDTVFLEKAAPVEDWESLFRGTIGSALAFNDYNRHVVAWFAKRGLKA